MVQPLLWLPSPRDRVSFAGHGFSCPQETAGTRPRVFVASVVSHPSGSLPSQLPVSVSACFPLPRVAAGKGLFADIGVEAMSRNPSCKIYIGNLDEKVSERVLYEILIQAGRLVDLYMPCDKESNRPKGFAFAEYESEEIANYAIRLFSGIVRLNNKTLKFAMSGQDKSSPNSATPVTPNQNTRPNLPEQQFVQALTSCRFSAHTQSAHPSYAQASPHGSGSNGSIHSSFEYDRRTFGQTMNTIHVQNSRY